MDSHMRGEWITRSLLQFVPLNSPSLLYNEAILSPQRQDSARVHETRSNWKRQVFNGGYSRLQYNTCFVHGDFATNIAVGNTFVSEHMHAGGFGNAYKSHRATVGNYPDPVNWRCGVCSGMSTSRTFQLLSTQILYRGQIFCPPIFIIFRKAN